MKKYIKILTVGLIMALLCAAAVLVGCGESVEPAVYRVVYTAGEGGRIEGEAEQEVASGRDGKTVSAVPDEGYIFLRWSDGKTRTARQEIDVRSDIALEAQFRRSGSQGDSKPKSEYTVKYLASAGGTIAGEAVQTVKSGRDGQAVTAEPTEGYRFVRWSDGLETAERQENNIRADKTLIAEFEKITLTVRYECEKGMINIRTEGGKTYGGTAIDFKVKYGEDCEKIVWVEVLTPDAKFLGWADGAAEPERQEKKVTSDITVRAKIGYELIYKVSETGGGSIIGESRCLTEIGEASAAVEAVPDEGYVFSGWSDLCMSTVHRVSKAERNFEYIAYFEPIKKTFRYDYGEGYGAPLKREITLGRNTLNEAEFVIPQREGYTFRGWYADDDYSLKVVHESGKLMLGYQTLNVESDTLYARWEKVGEEPITYKILMIMVDEIYASLYSTKAEKDVLVDYKMTAIERQICSAIPPKMSYYLHKWFEGKVIFEFDIYFTREVIKKESFRVGTDSTGHIGYSIVAYNIPEVSDIMNEYECTMVTLGLGSLYNYKMLSNEGGLGGAKHAMVFMTNNIDIFGQWPNQNLLQDIKNYNIDWEDDQYFTGCCIAYFHEFVHTVEMRFNDVYDFHKWLMPENPLERIRLYLLNQAGLDGEGVGIPPSYWEKFYTDKEVKMT